MQCFPSIKGFTYQIVKRFRFIADVIAHPTHWMATTTAAHIASDPSSDVKSVLRYLS